EASPLRWLKALTPGFLRRAGLRRPVPDSRRPGELRAALDVRFLETRVQQGTNFPVQVTAKNIGHAVWLSRSAPRGCVNLGVRLFDQGGREVDPNYWRTPLTPAAAEPTLPGETRSFEAAVPPPPRG